MQETKLSATTNANDSPDKTADVALAEDKSSAAPAPTPAPAQVPAPASAHDAKDTISVAEELRESQQAAAAIRDKQYHPIILSDLSNQASTSLAWLSSLLAIFTSLLGYCLIRYHPHYSSWRFRRCNRPILKAFYRSGDGGSRKAIC